MAARTFALPSLLGGAVGAVGAASRSRHPIEGVVDMLENLITQVRTEGQAEEVTYAKFDHWCKISDSTLDKAIRDGKSTIASLETLIDAKTKEEDVLKKHIRTLENEILEFTRAGDEAKTVRDDANALYLQADQDMANTITAIESAITGLEASAPSMVQKKVLLKLLQSPLVQGKLTDDQAAILSRQDPDILAAGDRAAHVQQYDFKSGNVIDLLKELVRKFEDDLVAGTTQETAAQNAYNLAKQARDAAKAAAEASKAEKETTLGAVQSDLATAKDDLASAQDDLAADDTTKEDTINSCEMKQSEWDERSKVRDHEIAAMKEATTIMEKVTGVRTEAPTNPVPPPSPVAFLQHLPRVAGGGGDPKARAINLLRATARKLKSRALEQFAARVAEAAGGPFDEVNSMIQKMIFQLMNEQKDEDDHKNWCDLEISKTNASSINKEEKISGLTTKIDEAKAKVALMMEEIAEAQGMITTIDEHMAEATEVREIGKKENAAAIKDAKDAQVALVQAVSVLETHYKDSGMIALQAPVTLPENPATWDSSYTGVADPKAPGEGIVAILEQISSDFAEMEADTMAQEATDNKAYGEDMKACSIEKARRAKEIEMKNSESKRMVDKTTAMEGSRKHVSDELYAVEQYMKDLAPACMEGDSTYEDRRDARSAEIEALKEAQVILANAFASGPAPAPAPAAAFLVPVTHHRQ